MNHLILVLGCHRSGTSLAARSLRCLGANLGEAANWSAPDNPKGFHEHRGFLRFDEILLEELSRRWDDERPYDSAFHLFDRLNIKAKRMRQDARVGFQAELTEHAPIFGLKEPRMSRLLPFWRPIFEAAGCEVSVVHAIRNPLAVALSLAQRDRIDVARAMKLWLEYNRAILRDKNPDWRTVVVDYDDMLASPMIQLRRLSSTLGFPLIGLETELFVDSAVDDGLRHQRALTSDLLPDDVQALWTQLKGKAAV